MYLSLIIENLTKTDMEKEVSDNIWSHEVRKLMLVTCNEIEDLELCYSLFSLDRWFVFIECFSPLLARTWTQLS